MMRVQERCRPRAAREECLGQDGGLHIDGSGASDFQRWPCTEVASGGRRSRFNLPLAQASLARATSSGPTTAKIRTKIWSITAFLARPYSPGAPAVLWASRRFVTS
jgi:hypothetical protein